MAENALTNTEFPSAEAGQLPRRAKARGEQPLQVSARRKRLLALYRTVHLGALTVSVGGGFCLLMASWYRWPHLIVEVVAISLGSAVVAQASVAVGSLGIFSLPARTRDPEAEAERAMQVNLTGAMAGMLVRLVGTVALFLYCRYQLAASDEVIAALVLGWYVVLTGLDVYLLTRVLPAADRKPESDQAQSQSLAANVAAGTVASPLQPPKHAG